MTQWVKLPSGWLNLGQVARAGEGARGGAIVVYHGFDPSETGTYYTGEDETILRGVLNTLSENVATRADIAAAKPPGVPNARAV